MSNLLQTVEADVKAFITTVENDGAKVLAWVEKEVPGSSTAINAIVTDAKTAAVTLAQLVAQDASGAISSFAGDIETAVGNFLNAKGLPTVTGNALTEDGTSAIQMAEQVAQAAISVGLTKLVALAAPAVAV